MKLTTVPTLGLTAAPFPSAAAKPAVTPNDWQIEAKVQQVLGREHSFKGSSISAALIQSVVLLKGNVRSEAERTLAQQSRRCRQQSPRITCSSRAGRPRQASPREGTCAEGDQFCSSDMAEQMEMPPKQIAAFLHLLIGTATTQTRKNGEFTITDLSKLVKAQRAARTVRPVGRSVVRSQISQRRVLRKFFLLTSAVPALGFFNFI